MPDGQTRKGKKGISDAIPSTKELGGGFTQRNQQGELISVTEKTLARKIK